MNILVSACLLGIPCRYNGTGVRTAALLRALPLHRLIPVCPEQLGGLPTPRPPAERAGERVLTRNGDDVTAAFSRGAEITLSIARMYGCSHAILKSKSPSCGSGQIYDGSFSGKLVDGYGITAQRLLAEGLLISDEYTVCASHLY